MSLINDALKRTRDASFQSGQSRPMTVDAYRVSNRTESSSIGSRSGVWVTMLVIVMAAVTATIFGLRLMRPSQRLHDALEMNSESKNVGRMSSRGAASGDAAYNKSIPVATVKPDRKVEEDKLVDRVVEKLKAEQPAAPPPPPEPPKFALQGITSGAGGREAMINGINVREGDEVDGARVVAIESRRVKLQLGEREILLRMP